MLSATEEASEPAPGWSHSLQACPDAVLYRWWSLPQGVSANKAENRGCHHLRVSYRCWKPQLTRLNKSQRLLCLAITLIAPGEV